MNALLRRHRLMRACHQFSKAVPAWTKRVLSDGLLEKRHGDDIAIVGEQHMKLFSLGEEEARGNLRHAGLPRMAKIKHDPFIGPGYRQCFGETPSQVVPIAFIKRLM